VTQLGSPATESGPGDRGRAVRGSRLARRRRALFWVAGGAALLAIGGLIGSSFVKSPQQIAADTAAPPPTATTAKVVSQVLTSSVQMRGVVYPATQYDVYPSAPESDSSASGTGSAAGGSAGGGSAAGVGSAGSVYISRLNGPVGNLPTGARAAAGKCFNILQNLNNATLARYLSIVETLNNYIGAAVINDGEFHAAMRRWSACMAKQGFHSADANTFSQQAQEMLGQRLVPGQNPNGPPGQPTAAQNKEQIAMAVADANCTLSSDLSGVYFAVQADYEKHFVSANQQALDAGIREYKAAFAKTLKTMPKLLQTTSATPNLPELGRPGHHGRHTGAAKPSPSSS
jgi:hypothetical protein